MAATIDATVGGSESNSYTTLAEANAYHETVPVALGEVWDGEEDDAKNRALITATSLLDEYMEWDGVAANRTQKLGWPRFGLNYPETDGLIPSDVLPDRLKRATAELARLNLSGDRTADSDADIAGLKSLKAGPVELQFRDGIAAKPIPDRVARMLAPWGRVLQRQSSVPLVRV